MHIHHNKPHWSIEYTGSKQTKESAYIPRQNIGPKVAHTKFYPQRIMFSYSQPLDKSVLYSYRNQSQIETDNKGTANSSNGASKPYIL